jgi:hypothetical protein
LIACGDGHIVNVSSGFGLFAVPYQSGIADIALSKPSAESGITA